MLGRWFLTWIHRASRLATCNVYEETKMINLEFQPVQRLRGSLFLSGWKPHELHRMRPKRCWHTTKEGANYCTVFLPHSTPQRCQRTKRRRGAGRKHTLTRKLKYFFT